MNKWTFDKTYSFYNLANLLDIVGSLFFSCKILKIISNLFVYAYDKLSRLIREDNKKLGKTYLYSYDNCGNMLSKRIASYTTKSAEEIAFTQEFLYSHAGDKLVSVNDQVLLYDEYGRLTDYNGKNFSWQRNRLASVDDVAITYDVFGRRTSKGETTFTYDSNNNLLNEVEFL